MVPAQPAVVGLHNFQHVKPDFSEHAIFVNLDGERFDDEYLGDEVTVQAAVRQREAIAILIYDEAIRRTKASPPDDADPGADRIASIRQSGGQILEAESLDALAQQMAVAWTVPARKLHETVTRYNAACAAADASSLDISKSGGLCPITTPPFYAVRMKPGITFTYGGVRINAKTEVLDSAGQRIEGLYAAGADAGGVYTRGYTGGLSLALAFGLIAGKRAAERLKPK